MQDTQNTKDNRNIELGEVGVKDVIVPLFIPSRTKKRQFVVARIKMSVSLTKDYKGTHMSRFIEVIEYYRNYNFNNYSISQILRKLKKRLKANSAYLEVSFNYFIKKQSPISGKKSLMNYECKIIGQSIKNNKIETFLNVLVPISSVCPCSKAISKYGAHNQRGVVNLKVKTNKFVWFEDLISLVEEYGGSGEVYSLLKRKDEKYLTERMFDNPKFVEDAVRDIAISLKKDKRIMSSSIECTNYESIHNHNAYAKITN